MAKFFVRFDNKAAQSTKIIVNMQYQPFCFFFSLFIVTRKKKKCQKKKKHKDSHFKDERLSDPRFKKWVKRYPGDSKKAICV